ncbi:MAG: valine--tRNA ligase [Planctomycetota bacterium]|nr:valine--tRNA ligase [Planctomycetota bacterium]
MSTDLPKAFDPRQAQKYCLELWSRLDLFTARPASEKPAFSMVIPPPNVTGALHLGHALNNTLQDILARQHRARGFDTCWIPGTDHAGIATQAVVEKRIRDLEGKNRHDLGRPELVRRIWEWKEQYGSRILEQLREMGCSCDWSRTRFTLDPVCATAVRRTFLNLFRAGHIYRGKRLVNWDTQLQTSVADDETFVETVKGGFWTFRYPLVDGSGHIRFSTTRPETMLGDVAIAVHPEDPRYKAWIGKLVEVPLAGRQIPIIADALLVDPELGTGAVKVTPAHDRNDHACGQRNNLPLLNILNPDGTLNDQCGKYAGLDRYVAREKVVEDMEALGFFEGREDRDIDLAHSDRSKSPIEPLLSDQWFIGMNELAEKAMDAVRDGRVKITPARYASTYLDWLGEKRDWCISRQLWWGHQIPIWHVHCNESVLEKQLAGRTDIFWRESTTGGFHLCAQEDLPADLLGTDYPLTRDPDVLDTWFSSALWPESTLGWPGETAEMARYYPTSVLSTSRDIITLWVARMVICGLFNTGEIPFNRVYIHPKITDGFGETMSKSKGNGVDPLDIIDRYGPDALRFQMALMATETQDARMPVANACPHCDTLVPVKQEHMYMRTKKLACPGCKKSFRPGGPWLAADPELTTAKQASDRFEQGRNFATKVWNATRFCLMNLEGHTPGALVPTELTVEDRWILSRLANAIAGVDLALDQFRFSEAIKLVYDFTWSDFCDWYLELAKGRLRDPANRTTAQRVLVGVLDQLARLLQPFMPFLAETLWQALNEAAPLRGLAAAEKQVESVVIAKWPVIESHWRDTGVEAVVDRMQRLVRLARETRNRYQIDARTPLHMRARMTRELADGLAPLAPLMRDLAGLGDLELGPDVQRPGLASSLGEADFEAFVLLEGIIDPAAERERLLKQRLDKEKNLAGIRAKLGNASFVERAPAEVVVQQRATQAELEEQISSINQNLASLPL